MPVEADAWEKMRPLSHIGGGVGCADLTGPRVRGWFSFKQSTLDAALAESGREIKARSSTRISLSAAEISASDWLIFHWLMAKYARDIARL